MLMTIGLRFTDNIIDDTGFMISDYTVDDIDLNANDAPNTAYFMSPKNEDRHRQTSPGRHDDREVRTRAGVSDRQSLTRKRNPRRSTSLTRNADSHAQKRSRTRSTDVS